MEESGRAAVYLTVPEVAARCRVRIGTVRGWLRTGRLAGVMPGGQKSGYRVESGAVEALLSGVRRD
jgi:excisionase family DNA binding protein